MKGIKVSKASWLILSAGVFVVVLAGLGLTRSQQMKEQDRVADELKLTATRLEALQTAALSQRLEDLRVQLADDESQMKLARERLRQTVVSVDVVDEFYAMAKLNNVKVSSLNNSKINKAKYGGRDFFTTSIAASVQGAQADIINLVIGLNKGYTTGYVESVSLSIGGEALEIPPPEEEIPEEEQDAQEGEEEPVEEEPEEVAVDETAVTSAVISLIIYSIEG